MVSRSLNLGLRGLQVRNFFAKHCAMSLTSCQFFCALIVMALVGNMIATSFRGNSAMVNYDMFVAVFGMLSLLYLIPTTFLDSFSVPIVNIALDVLNVLFWFCAAVATAAYLGVHSCNNAVRSLSFRYRIIDVSKHELTETGLHDLQPHHQRLPQHY